MDCGGVDGNMFLHRSYLVVAVTTLKIHSSGLHSMQALLKDNAR
jgi:hypothetical protein